MRKISADIIYTGSSSPILDGLILLEDKGKIIEVLSSCENFELSEIEKYSGAICPGFVNAHCHLELSFMKGRISPKLGLDQFINEVEKNKKVSSQATEIAMREAESEMLRNGIVAVGDISNTAASFELKGKSKLHYHTFIEIYAFDPLKANAAMTKGLELFEYYQKIDSKNTASITAHAPYSSSSELLNRIKIFNGKGSMPLSIHNQESAEENRMFIEGKGKVLERIKNFGINTDFWQVPGISSLKWLLNHLKLNNKIQMVHNTYTSKEDIEIAEKNHSLYWCFCPKANLYIEDNLPDFSNFDSNRITIGTDSYASNDSLNILEELKVISKNSPQISFEKLIKWSTFNGAVFLSMERELGSIEKGKTPGLNLISNFNLNTFQLTASSSIKVLV